MRQRTFSQPWFQKQGFQKRWLQKQWPQNIAMSIGVLVKFTDAMKGKAVKAIVLVALLSWFTNVLAHHVLGRPSYSLNEDSNTPPSMQVETQIGEYYITYMAFPAFPKPNEAGRVNLYASRIDNGGLFIGDITFKVRDDSWFADKEELLGVQQIDDGVYRQGFIFKEAGDFIISAEFSEAGEHYVIDFPLRIGEPISLGPVGITVIIVLVVMVTVSISQRKRLQRLKARQHHNAMGE